MSRRKKRAKAPFVMMPLAILNSAAWIEVDPTGRLLWIALRRKLRNDGLNNGKIYLSCRNAAKEIGIDKSTAAVQFMALEHYGFLRKTTEACLGVDGEGISPHYRFTDLAYGSHAVTLDYQRWTGEIFERPKKQNPVRIIRTPRTDNPDIGLEVGEPALCTDNPDIVSQHVGHFLTFSAETWISGRKGWMLWNRGSGLRF
jgi:hypothetical protein